MGDVYSSKFTAPAGSNSVTFSVDYPQNSGTQDLSITKPGGQEIKQEDFAANGITLLTNQNTSTSLNCLIGDPNSTTLLPAGDYTVKLYSTNYQFPDQKVKHRQHPQRRQRPGEDHAGDARRRDQARRYRDDRG